MLTRYSEAALNSVRQLYQLIITLAELKVFQKNGHPCIQSEPNGRIIPQIQIQKRLMNTLLDTTENLFFLKVQQNGNGKRWLVH